MVNSNTHWLEVFNKCDSNGDGHISLQEFQKLINAGGCKDIPKKNINQIMKITETYYYGRLSCDEFLNVVDQPETENQFQHLFQRYVNILVPRNERFQYSMWHLQKTDHSSCCPPIICLPIVSIIELILYLIDVFVNHTKGTGPIATQLVYNPYKRYESWRYLTYMFVHIGSVHLIVNLILQLSIGIPLEKIHRWRILIVYLAGVVAGSHGLSIIYPGVFLAGASGGVYALFCAFLVHLCLNWSQMKKPIIQLLFFICIMGADFGIAVYKRYYLESEIDEGYIAHLAGAVAGLSVGIGVSRNMNEKKWKRYLWWCALVSYFILVTTAVSINLFWTSHFPSSLHNS